MDNNRSKVYLRNKGTHCPHCSSRNFARLGPIEESQTLDGVVLQQSECHDCGKLWTDQYMLTSVDMQEGQ